MLDTQRTAMVLLKQQVKDLKIIAAQHDTSMSVVVRALVDDGMARLADGDERVLAAIAKAAEEESERRRETGLRAMESRYGKTYTDKDSDKKNDPGDERRE